LNEEQIAKALTPYPEGLAIATKCGLERYKTSGVDEIQSRLKGSREEIRASAEGSLQRLRRQQIDLLQLHRIDPQVRLEVSVEALAELQSEGKVRHIGLSEVSLDELKRGVAVAPIASVQNRYNVRDRGHEQVLTYCEERGIAFLPWFPLGNGGLCKADGPLAGVASRHGVTPSQIALAWLLARSPVLIPIPGTASIEHLRENVAAVDLRLSAADLAELDQIGSKRS
jgi:aryl-alcohol dehydrogenase-like predicted oxidoreductase